MSNEIFIDRKVAVWDNGKIIFNLDEAVLKPSDKETKKDPLSQIFSDGIALLK